MIGAAIFAVAVFIGTSYWYLGSHRVRHALQLIGRLITSDPYGDFHNDLNVVPTEPASGSKASPRTRWMNMGYWTADAQSFPQACEALAKKAILAAHCLEGGRVLDVGHGCGDSLILHLRDPSVPRPSFLQGITSERKQAEIAKARCLPIIPERSGIQTKVQISHGDAVYQPCKYASRTTAIHEHPLDPHNPSPPFSSIVAIDCAFHFRNRQLFLSQSFQRLAPGGYIGLADMGLVLLSPPSTPSALLRKLLARTICTMLSVPIENMLTPEFYMAQLLEIGFVECKVEVISEHVFPPLIEFLKSRAYRKDLGLSWWIAGSIFDVWWRFCGATYILVEAKRPL